MPTAHDLHKLHVRLQRVFGDALNRRVAVNSPDVQPDQLAKLHSGGIAAFELAPADGIGEFALSRGKKRFAFPLLPVSSNEDRYKARCWVGWHEIWRCLKKNSFDLQLASWTVHWGYIGDERKSQVVRAEWDQIHRLEQTGTSAGHPHWHVDAEISLPVFESDEGIEELKQESGSRLNIQKMHLAMGGWRNGGSVSDVPACWQCDFGGAVDEVADWGDRTLRYLQSQADLIRPPS